MVANAVTLLNDHEILFSSKWTELTVGQSRNR
jgi:hypothetical protein